MNMEFLRNLDHYIKAKQYRLVNAIVIYQNGELVFERYYNKFDENTLNTMMSVWKSVLSITLGICLDKGLIKSIDEPIYTLLPQFAQNIDPLHRQITIRHLLTMSSGIYFNPGPKYSCPMLEQFRRAKDPILHIANVQVTNPPGTKFLYKEWDTILLAEIIGKAYGGTADSAINEFLYEPLGISNKGKKASKCGVCGNVCTCNKITATDMAKIGNHMLNHASQEYVNLSTTPSQASQDYGFLWWLFEGGYRGLGFGGQELNIYPDKKIVAIVQATATTKNKQYRDICEGIFR
ncbi:MAG: beta-lactamase family protein [Defluviitaleaceae bacterium]|nr:beta-lactamase family protein [Defluviitaleaceae bacterium]